jgi:hypothetical protein
VINRDSPGGANHDLRKADTPPRDLAIAYRIYPKVAKPAEGLPFSEDKFQLSEICLRSFKESLGNLRVKLWVLLDGCPKEYAELFRKYFDSEDLVLLALPGVGNLATFEKQIELLLEQKESELVYFAEDDYFYLPRQFHLMIDFLLHRENVHFVSPYDHFDCYTLDLHRLPKWLCVYGGRHWRTAASTCLTFLTRRETLRKTEAIFRNYTRTSLDCSLWLSLTKDRVFNPFFFGSHMFRDFVFCKTILKSWVYFWRQILFGKKWMLWVPIPGIATHLNTQAMSPTIDWVKLMEQKAETTPRLSDTVRHA